MKWLVVTCSVLALAASPAFAQGNGKGNGNNNQGGPPERAGSPSDNNGNGNRNDNGNGNGNGGALRANRGNGNAQARPDDRANNNGNRADRPRVAASGNRAAPSRNPGNGNSNGNADVGRPALVSNRANGNGNGRSGDGARERNAGLDLRTETDRLRDLRRASTGLIQGCPPGLARRNNGCTPPGLAREARTDYRFSRYTPDWWGLPHSREGRYLFDDGYLLRLNGDSVSGYIPLLGGALATGNTWPTGYGFAELPNYYTDYFGLGPSGSYRFADNVVYRVDPETAAITSIAALLTGDDFTVGQPAPSGYEVYNVPYSYRDRYYDTPQANYRYSDGYVYQIDPTTRLVNAAIDLLI